MHRRELAGVSSEIIFIYIESRPDMRDLLPNMSFDNDEKDPILGDGNNILVRFIIDHFLPKMIPFTGSERSQYFTTFHIFSINCFHIFIFRPYCCLKARKLLENHCCLHWI